MSPVRIGSVDQAISIIPHLLGYRPREDLVILVVNPRLICTVRADLEEVRTAEGFAALLGPVTTRFPNTQLLMVAWSDDPRRARGVLALAESMLGPERVLDAVSTDGRRWWSLCCESSRCDEEGHEVVLDEGVRAEAVYRGLGVLPDRGALAASVAGPTADQLTADSALLIETAQWAAGLSREEAVVEVAHIWDEISTGDEPPDLRTALRLAQLSCDDEVATALWASTTPAMARPLVGAWSQVIAHVPEPMAARPLVLCGLAAWLVGDGALESCCLERAGRLDPDLLLFRALDVLQRNALHPSVWSETVMDPELIARGILEDRSSEPPEALAVRAGRGDRAGKRSRGGRRRRR